MAILLATSVVTLGQSCYENDSLITNGDSLAEILLGSNGDGIVQWRFD